MKQKVEEVRKQSRAESKRKAEILLQLGDKFSSEKKYIEAIEITNQMVYRFIQTLSETPGVTCIVAPYEADAQLAYLFLKEQVSVIFTEDSDLLAFGVTKVFYRFGMGGYGFEINMENVEKAHELFERIPFDPIKFLSLCIFSGCDYLDSIKGIGFKRGIKIMGEHDFDI